MAFDASQTKSIEHSIAEWLSRNPAVVEEIVEKSLDDTGEWDGGSVSFGLESIKKRGNHFVIEGTLRFRVTWEADQGPADLSAECKLGVQVSDPNDSSPSVSSVWLKN